MDGLKEGLSTFKNNLDGNLKGKAKCFNDILENHGECQIVLASGTIHSLHLGDKGDFDESVVTYVDKEGNYICIFWDQVESVNFHLGYKD
jgi:hypothetical protein